MIDVLECDTSGITSGITSGKEARNHGCIARSRGTTSGELIERTRPRGDPRLKATWKTRLSELCHCHGNWRKSPVSSPHHARARALVIPVIPSSRARIAKDRWNLNLIECLSLSRPRNEYLHSLRIARARGPAHGEPVVRQEFPIAISKGKTDGFNCARLDVTRCRVRSAFSTIISLRRFAHRFAQTSNERNIHGPSYDPFTGATPRSLNEDVNELCWDSDIGTRSWTSGAR